MVSIPLGLVWAVDYFLIKLHLGIVCDSMTKMGPNDSIGRVWVGDYFLMKLHLGVVYDSITQLGN